MRRGAIFMLVAIGLLAAALAVAVAIFVPWLPTSASEEREGIDFVFWLTTAICIGIFAIVAAVTVYSAIKFRVDPDDDSDGEPIHGHTGLEIVWTAVPTVLVTVIAVASGIVLARNDRVGGDTKPNRVDVTAIQFAWNFKYRDEISSPNLYLPIGRPTKLFIRAQDVIHSFWVPEFGQKQDAVPGIVTTLVITPTRLGEYRLMCTELCGLGHALMRSRAIVMRPQAYERWLRQQRQATAAPAEEGGLAVFEEQGCDGCHALAAAKATGKAGPSLDELPAQARRAGQPLEEFVRESIVEPNEYIEPGYSKNVMPSTYGQLSDEQLDSLVQYLVESSEGGK